MTQAAVLAASGSPGTTTGFKNRIINGAMVIDQRNAGASVNPNNGTSTYTLDRWQVYVDASNSITVQQSSTAPVGFVNSLLVTSTAATTPSSGQAFILRQKIEGYNTSDLNWGTSDAKTITISFWARSSLTGVFGAILKNSAGNRCYPFTYTINAANTWEQKTITITGDSTGTWLTTNGIGIYLAFSLGAGSSKQGTAGAWTSTDYDSATGATNLVATNGATLYVTGVQLEVGTQATTFDYRSYGTELALCQRYYEEIGRSSSGGLLMAGCTTVIGQQVNTTFVYKVTKRTAPTVTRVGSWNLINIAGQPNIYGADIDNVLFYASSSATGSAYAQNSNANNYITISAEL